MEFLDRAIEATDGHSGRGRLAVDLGCGAGNESIALLKMGWRVHAVDAEPRAVEILTERVPKGLAEMLTTQVSMFHEASLPEADLVFASLSLPFAAERLGESVAVAVGAVRPGGWFVGVFFGPNDTWASEENVATVEADEIETMLDGFRKIGIEESEFDGPSGAGPKHWHWYVASAYRPE